MGVIHFVTNFIGYAKQIVLVTYYIIRLAPCLQPHKNKCINESYFNGTSHCSPTNSIDVYFSCIKYPIIYYTIAAVLQC